MAREQVTVRLQVPSPDKETPTTHLIHGHIGEDGFIHHTSIGRGAQDLLLTDFTHVTEVKEIPNGKTDGVRTVSLGEGILYVYEELQFVNRGGEIWMLATGFNDREEWTHLSQKEIIGGSIPNTQFEARPSPGIQIYAYQS